ncbi:MAG: TRCF domain-containing protein, partial [Pirellulales bacterium]
RDYIADLRSKIDFYRRISRAAAHTQVDDLETEIEDRFGPLPLAFRRLLDLARLRITASSLSIDSISKQPGLLVIGHHDMHCIEKWRQRCILSGQEVRVVGNKTIVLPLHERIAGDENKLFQTVKKLFQIK